MSAVGGGCAARRGARRGAQEEEHEEEGHSDDGGGDGDGAHDGAHAAGGRRKKSGKKAAAHVGDEVEFHIHSDPAARCVAAAGLRARRGAGRARGAALGCGAV